MVKPIIISTRNLMPMLILHITHQYINHNQTIEVSEGFIDNCQNFTQPQPENHFTSMKCTKQHTYIISQRNKIPKKKAIFNETHEKPIRKNQLGLTNLTKL